MPIPSEASEESVPAATHPDGSENARATPMHEEQ
jgi:hypothetical protein